jgi:CheY-like chemotaxis protein
MSRKILIVEDFCDLRELLGMVLVASGWNPILAESGRKALAKLERETPSVILMDMRLPDMNGFELAAILKNHRSTGVYPFLRQPRIPAAQPGSAVLRQAAMISFPSLSRLPRSKRVLQI